MNRRTFLTSLLALPASARAAGDFKCDIAVIGAGVGGCAAALAALRNGMRVVLTEETDWIGGQLTSPAVPPDEPARVQKFRCTRLDPDYRNPGPDYYPHD